MALLACCQFMFQKHLRSYQDGHQLVYVHTQGAFSIVVGVMKMGTTVPRAGIEATSSASECNHYIMQAPSCYHPTHTYLSMQLLA